MTNQEAAKILRTENLGDSEQMELAKQMGARALDKHKVPLWCRIRRALVGSSPSTFAWCGLGLRKTIRKCEGCQKNTGLICLEAFQSGLKSPPPFKISADGRTVHILRGEQHNENNQN